MGGTPVRGRRWRPRDHRDQNDHQRQRHHHRHHHHQRQRHHHHHHHQRQRHHHHHHQRQQRRGSRTRDPRVRRGPLVSSSPDSIGALILCGLACLLCSLALGMLETDRSSGRSGVLHFRDSILIYAEFDFAYSCE